MKEFEKYQSKRVIKTIGYLTNHGAYIAGEKQGWKAALERVLKHTKQINRGRIGIIDWIEQELEESK